MGFSLRENLLELIRRTSTDLPGDVEAALRRAVEAEKGRARGTLELILRNVEEARRNSIPICQDTGTLIFRVGHCRDMSPEEIRADIEEAVKRATEASFLRPNAVHPISGRNSGNNLGLGSPVLFFHQQSQGLSVELMIKGGGSENCGIQYSLPDSGLGAGRDLRGIKLCLMDAVYKAQGFGCAPGTLGVGIGGDRVTSFLESKEQLFRSLDHENPDPELRRLEEEILQKANSLGIGPMGFGGQTTLLGVKAGVRHRHPACFFVSVSYMCWAYRRRRLVVEDGRAVID
jgi:fumarate hydratase class I